MATKQRTLAQEARTLRALRKKKEDTDKRAKEAKLAYDQHERYLMERMEAEEVGSIRVAGVLFSPTRTEYGKVQDPATFMAWAKENMPELLEQKPRKGLIHDEVRKRIADNVPMPPGLGFYVDEYISQRAS